MAAVVAMGSSTYLGSSTPGITFGRALVQAQGSRLVVGCSLSSPPEVQSAGFRAGGLNLESGGVRRESVSHAAQLWRDRGNRGASIVCQCVAPLTQADGNVTEVEDPEAFDQILQEAGDKLVVVDVSTTTCGPCKMIFPKLVKMSIEYPDVVFLKINGDKNNETRTLMRKWGVRAVPNFRFFRNGELIHSHTGAKVDELRAHFLTHYAATVKA